MSSTISGYPPKTVIPVAEVSSSITRNTEHGTQNTEHGTFQTLQTSNFSNFKPLKPFNAERGTFQTPVLQVTASLTILFLLNNEAVTKINSFQFFK